MNRHRLKTIFRAVTILSYLVAYTATHLPPGRVPRVAALNDKLLHFATYFVLGMMTTFLCRFSRNIAYSTAAMIFVCILTYAVFDEITQPLVGRTFEFADLAADASGAALAILIAKFVPLKTSGDSKLGSG